MLGRLRRPARGWKEVVNSRKLRRTRVARVMGSPPDEDDDLS